MAMKPERLAEIENGLPYGYPPPWTVQPWFEDDERRVLGGWLVQAAGATEHSGIVLLAEDYGEHLALWAAKAREQIPELAAEVKRLQSRVVELTRLLNDPDRLAEELRELRAILSYADSEAEVDRLADGGDV